jgi:hypothetical protein
MWQLYARFYGGATRAQFDLDLCAKSEVFLLQDADTQLQGFSTLAVTDFEFESEILRILFSGDTIIAREHWGSQALAFAWLRHAGDLVRARPTTRHFWFLIVKGHRTFRYLPAFAREFHPHWERSTPPQTARLMHALAAERFGAAYDPDRGIVHFEQTHGFLAPPHSDVSARERARPEVEFFLRRNPGYLRGDELVCLCELAPDNLRPLARRVFESKPSDESVARV